MNSTRITNQPPKDVMDPEDLMYTNTFISSTSTKDTTDNQKQEFIEYYNQKRRSQQIKTSIEKINQDVQNYDYFASNSRNVIEKVKDNTIKIEESYIVDIDTRNRDKNLYSSPSDFIIPLGKTFYNVKSIELVSSAIPNTDQTITNTPIQIRNNRISWQNREDYDLGYFLNASLTTTIDNYVDITITNHYLASQVHQGNFYVNITNSTSNPNIDGERYAEIVDSNTIRIPFQGGIISTASAIVDTGFPTYTVELTPGNYNATSIVAEISKQMNLVKRRNNIGVVYHYFTVEVSLDTDVITFSSYITKQLSGNPLSTQSGTGVITVSSFGHGYKTGDQVLIIGAKNTGGLSSNILNGLYTVSVLSSDTFSYEVNERANAPGDGGGSTIKTGKPSEFRLLFDTANSLIVNNIGFPDEDSSELLGTNSTPITTKIIKPVDIEILGDYVHFTCNNHGLESAQIYSISGITVGNTPIVTVSTKHNIGSEETVYIQYLHSTPQLDGNYNITVTGNNTFRINTMHISKNPGGFGKLKHSGDQILLTNFKSIPVITGKPLIIENATTNTFDIEVSLTEIQTSSILETIIGTQQINVYHPNHNFNTISDISFYSNTQTLITTKVNHNLNGIKYNSILSETIITSTVDLTVVSHGLSTSDSVFISNSTNTPSIDGTYVIQIVSANIFRISFIGGATAGTCDINFGDSVVFSNTNSIPNITTNVNGNVRYYINKLSDIQFTIDTGYPITTAGTYGIIGRNNNFTLHRIESSQPNGDNLGGIPLSRLNHVYYKISSIIDENNYMFRTDKYASSSISAGGNNVVITSQRHGYRSFQSNTYSGEPSGVLYKSISLEGENYVFLISPNLQTVYSPGNETVGDIFAKILLNQAPGLLMFDSFVSTPKRFNPPLSYLKSLQFTVKRKDGYLFNFNNSDFSISLRITEIIDRIQGSNISSRTGTSDLR